MPASTPPPVVPGSPGALVPSRSRSPVGSQSPGALSHPLPAGMRDLLPVEARRQQAVTRSLLGTFDAFGYEPVSVPPFEYAQVLEQDMGPLDPSQVLRFVEPETGEVVALRPDMTPQIARLVATRLSDAPPPIRLCYEGAVVRRRAERARRGRQIHQAGIELMGQSGPEGDLEVLTVAASAVRGTGLTDFTLDLGHAGIAGSLVQALPPESRRGVVEALSAKDAEETRRRAEAGGLTGAALSALVELPSLYGATEVWARAERALAGTAAEAPARELRELYDAVDRAGLAPRLVADLGETWTFAYYTGMLFQVLADGPGEPVGSGGRYDRLFDRFGAPRPAAGFAIDVGNLGWALERAGTQGASPPRLLVSAVPARLAEARALLTALRLRGIRCAEGPSATGAGGASLAHAKAWRYTHWLDLGAHAVCVDVATGNELTLAGAGAGAGENTDIAAALAATLDSRTPKEAT